MKRFSEYLDNVVAGRVSQKLIIFDVDDTLIHTTANIWVMKDGKRVKKITNSQYNNYSLKNGEYFDYSEFDDPDILANEEFTKYWDTLKREYNKGSHICILTARGSVDMVRTFLIKNGIDIKKGLVFATGDPSLGLIGNVQERKASVISLLYNKGYRQFIFFDDNEGNLRSVKNMEAKLPIKIIAIKAQKGS